MSDTRKLIDLQLLTKFKEMYDTLMSSQLSGKQDTLTAGNNISITNNVISATQPVPLEVNDITGLTTSQLDSLNAGDIVIKNDNGSRYTYMVCYKQTAEASLVYCDHENIEEVYYEKSGDVWSYIQTDTFNLAKELPPTLGTAGQVLTVNAGATGVEWAAPSGGMQNPMTAAGDLIVGGSSGAPARLAKGTQGKFLHTNASTGALEWSSLPSVETLQEVTYANLVSLRTNSQLVKGQFYRITDYNTIINGTYDLSVLGAQGYLHYAKSAEHQFDIIVQAIDVNKLNENAKAIQHSGDNYFVNNNLSAWELKYTLDNDANTYAWANSTSGKGVIYYMKDEFNNEAWYDFKNIQFLAYALTNTDTTKSLVYDSEEQPLRYGSVFHLIMALMSYMSSGEYSTPFNGGYDFYVGATILGAIQSSTVDATYLTTFNADWYYTFGGSSDLSLDGVACSNNKLSQMPDPLTYYAWLQNIITMSSVIDYGLPINILNGEEIKNNYFGYNSVINIFGSGECLNNRLVCNDYGNIFGDGCYSNTFGNNCYSNTFGDNCDSNIFGFNCDSNTFEYDCDSNTFGDNCSDNTFGNNCYSNTFKYDCYSNTFGDNCSYNTFGNNCRFNTFKYDYYSNTFGDNCSYNTFGNNCHFNTFKYDYYFNTFGDNCSYNTFGDNCYYNTFKYDCYSNTFGDNCSYNTVCDHCTYNIFGNACRSNKLSDSTTPFAYNYQRYNIFENGVSFVELRSASADGADNNYLQNVKVCQGVHGTPPAALKTITATRNLDYQVEYKATGSTEILV